MNLDVLVSGRILPVEQSTGKHKFLRKYVACVNTAPMTPAKS
jgi:hypothetical protein